MKLVSICSQVLYALSIFNKYAMYLCISIVSNGADEEQYGNSGSDDIDAEIDPDPESGAGEPNAVNVLGEYLGDSSSVLRKRGTKKFVTPRLLASLDQWKISSTAAVHVISATADALGHQIDDLILNRSTLHAMRKDYRKINAKKIVDNFSVI